MKLRAIIILVVVAAVLGVTFYAVSRPQPETPAEPRPFVWDFEMDALQNIELTLKAEQSVSFVKHEDRYFYFDVPNGSKVDMERWGGGIPLILSGPGAERRLVVDATAQQLKEYGFDEPTVKIKLTLNDANVYNVELGDATPSGQAYYIRLAELKDIYTVDYTWYDVVSRLVTEPPYPPPKFVNEKLTVVPEEAGTGQTVTISAEMVNTGALTGKYDVKLKVNGAVEGTESIELGRDQRQTVVFTIKKDVPGVYSLSVEGQTAKLVIR
ncbi:MAG: DUF4340 domain-containing protein [Dehalococcoidia bacterium]|nr:DUF4340 domain-containing protein [Dehalococcoidia bacterium]